MCSIKNGICHGLSLTVSVRILLIVKSDCHEIYLELLIDMSKNIQLFFECEIELSESLRQAGL